MSVSDPDSLSKGEILANELDTCTFKVDKLLCAFLRELKDNIKADNSESAFVWLSEAGFHDARRDILGALSHHLKCSAGRLGFEWPEPDLPDRIERYIDSL